MANEFVARNGIIAQNNSTITGSLTVTNGITGTISGTASYANNADLLDGLDSTVFTPTASFTAFSSSLNSFTSSATARFVGLEAATSSLNSYTSSATARFVGLETATASFSGRVGGLEAATASLNTYTSSATARFVGLETYTSSINAKTGSFATTGSNIFIGTQTLTGSIVQSGSFTTTGTIIAQSINVQQVTSSVVYSCGSNNFGTAIGNTQVFTGSMFITGSNITANVSNACFAGTVCAPTVISTGQVCGIMANFSCVGIGTTTPANAFNVSNNGASGFEVSPTGGINSGVLLQAYNRSTSAYMAQSYYACTHTFNVGGGGATRALDITSTGVVGIGTNTPVTDDGNLVVAGAVGTGQGMTCTTAQINIWETTSGNKAGLWFGAVNCANVGVIGSRTATGNIAFQTYCGGWGERMRIIYNGSVGIGSTSPYSNGLSVRGASDDYSLTVLQQNANTAGYGFFAGNSGDFSIARFSGGAYTSAALKIQLNTNVVCFANTICSAGAIFTSAVGVNTTTITDCLTVVGTTAFRGAASNTQVIQFEPSSTGAGGTSYIYSTYSGTASEGPLGLGTYSCKNAIYISPTCNRIGIGTTSPGTKLEVFSTALSADRTCPHNVLTITAEQGNAPYGPFGGAILFKNRSYVSGMVESARIRSVIYDDGAPNNCGGGIWLETTPTPGGTLTPSLVIDYQGRVGIGTTSPAYKLDTTALGYGIRHYGDSGNEIRTYAGSTYQTIFYKYGAGNDNGVGFVGGNYYVETSQTERMRITSGGLIGIGTTTPQTKVFVLGLAGGQTGAGGCGCSTYSGGGKPAIYSYFGDQYGNGAPYGSSAGAIAPYSVWYGGGAGGYFKGGNGDPSPGGGGAGIVAIGGDGSSYAASGAPYADGGAGIYARGGCNLLTGVRAWAGYFDGCVYACGNVGIGTTNISTEANLFLGAQGANEGGQLVLQKGTSCNCATHLDNYQDRFRVMSGTNTSSSAEKFSVDMNSGAVTTYGNILSMKSSGGGTYKQTVVGQISAAASGTAKKIAYVGHTHSVRVYVWANQSTGNGSSAIADIVTLYGSSSGGTTAEANFGNVSDISVTYDNGGSPAYTINVTLTYSGAAPTINYVIEGINNDNSIYTL